MNQRLSCRNSVRFLCCGLIAAAMAAVASIAAAQTPTLVKDINTGTDAAEDGFTWNVLADCGGNLYFSGEAKSTGEELWKTDGTQAGTQIVVEGGRGENSGLRPLYFACADSKVYFSRGELWKSDGTPSGTSIVKDIGPGTIGSFPKSLTSCGGLVYFQASLSATGEEPWVTDGTEAGTIMLGDIAPGSTDSMGGSTHFFDFGGYVYFAADDASGSGRELWRTDGTPSGTELFKDINTSGYGASGNPYGFTAVGSTTCFFSADDGTNGTELWKSDGTVAGTVMVADINSSGSSYFSEFAAMGGLLFFAADDGTNGLELWKSDGTAAGTVMVKEINISGSTYPQNFEVMGSILYFSATDGSGGAELWKTDGTSGGTVLVKDINLSGDSNPVYLEALGSTLLFAADDGSAGVELWKSDGTSAGTVMVADIDSGSSSSNPSYLKSWGGVVYFAATDGTTGVELWMTDGTAAGTEIVKNVYTEVGDSSPKNGRASGGVLYLNATDASTGAELWKTDGTNGGTVRVKNIRSGSSSSDPVALFDFSGTLLFGTNNGTQGYELWKSDGTDAGTVLVKDIRVGFSGSSPSYFASLVGEVVFAANDGTNGVELWKTDGTEAGTVLLKDIRPGFSGSSPRYMTALGGNLLFQASDGTNGIELWTTDGTPGGTVMLKDINPGSGGSSPTYLRRVGDTLYFRASDGTPGTELWKSDGTAAGTSMVTDMYGPYLVEGVYPIADMDGILYFRAEDAVHGRELWRSDGTESGTYMVKDLWPGSGESVPSLVGMVNGRLVLTAVDSTKGRELWITDGTEAGTTFLFDIIPGADGWYHYGLGSHDGFLYFSAFSFETGLEIWRTDGTAVGTLRVADVRPGPASSYTHTNYSYILGEQLLFAATDDVAGRELWGMCIGAFYQDLDGDGHGNPNVRVFACSQPPDYVKLSDDCDDDNGDIHPGASETCDAADNDCDGQIDNPTFAGLLSAVQLGGANCAISLDWDSTTACDGTPVYAVYRSTSSGFDPGPATLQSSCVAQTSWIDTAVSAGTTYYYVVRAENPSTGGNGQCYGGAEDDNLTELSVTPTACTTAAQDLPFLSARAASESVRLEWINPASGYGLTRICRKTGSQPTGPSDGVCVDVVGTAGQYGTTTHNTSNLGPITNGTKYFYGAWVNSESGGGGDWSGGRFTTGRPFDVSGSVKWAYTTGATVLATSGAIPGDRYFMVSNDRILHSTVAGPTGGIWPTGWVPAAMNAPAQGRPTVIRFGAPTVPDGSGASTVAFVGSQDGRVYAFDADTGDDLWASPVLGGAVQASPGGIFQIYGAAFDLLLVGTRTSTGASKFYGLNLLSGAIAWTFDNGGETTPANAIGIISSQAWVDPSNSRIYFTSRAKGGGSNQTIWCIDFTATSATFRWSAAVGNVDAAPTLWNDVLYAGNTSGVVYAFDAGTAGGSDVIPMWSYVAGDGAVKGYVWVNTQAGGDVLYFSTTGTVHAINDAGASVAGWSPPAVPGASPPFVIGDDLFVGTSTGNGSLLRLDKINGAQLGIVGLGDASVPKSVGNGTYDHVNDMIVLGCGTGEVFGVVGDF